MVVDLEEDAGKEHNVPDHFVASGEYKYFAFEKRGKYHDMLNLLYCLYFDFSSVLYLFIPG